MAPRRPPPRPGEGVRDRTVRSLPDRPISALVTDELPKAKEHELAPWCMEIANRIDAELVSVAEYAEQRKKLQFCEQMVVQLLRIAGMSCAIVGVPPETSLDDLEQRLRSLLSAGS